MTGNSTGDSVCNSDTPESTGESVYLDNAFGFEARLRADAVPIANGIYSSNDMQSNARSCSGIPSRKAFCGITRKRAWR